MTAHLIVKNLYLRNFRCYEEAYFEFSSGLNLIYGQNAKGKTSLLEALHLLMRGRSFRTSQWQDLIKNDQTGFQIESHFVKHEIEQRLRINALSTERKIIFNSTPLPHLSSLLGIIPGVLQTPDDINLIKGSPQLRRQFLDIQIAQIDPLYVHHLSRYTRAMQQRNQLLRRKSLVSIESWEQQMSHSAAYIILKRQATIQNLQTSAQNFHFTLTSEKAFLSLHYRSLPVALSQGEEVRDYLHKQYHKNREREKILGFTLTGPHKDDLMIAIDERDVRFFASEGQQRSCIAALHLAEWQNLQLTGIEKPLFMIDDISASLDRTRIALLIEQLTHLGQIFVTTTDQSLVEYYSNPSKSFSL